jgi:hypothetical protein
MEGGKDDYDEEYDDDEDKEEEYDDPRVPSCML